MGVSDLVLLAKKIAVGFCYLGPFSHPDWRLVGQSESVEKECAPNRRPIQGGLACELIPLFGRASSKDFVECLHLFTPCHPDVLPL